MLSHVDSEAFCTDELSSSLDEEDEFPMSGEVTLDDADSEGFTSPLVTGNSLASIPSVFGKSVLGSASSAQEVLAARSKEGVTEPETALDDEGADERPFAACAYEKPTAEAIAVCLVKMASRSIGGVVGAEYRLPQDGVVPKIDQTLEAVRTLNVCSLKASHAGCPHTQTTKALSSLFAVSQPGEMIK